MLDARMRTAMASLAPRWGSHHRENTVLSPIQQGSPPIVEVSSQCVRARISRIPSRAQKGTACIDTARCAASPTKRNSFVSVTDEKRVGLPTPPGSVSAREDDPRRSAPQGSDTRRANACGVGLQRKETDPAHRRNSPRHLLKDARRIDEALERPHRAYGLSALRR